MIYGSLLVCTNKLLNNLYRLKETSENTELIIFLLHELDIDEFIEVALHMTMKREYNNPEFRQIRMEIVDNYMKLEKFLNLTTGWQQFGNKKSRIQNK